jgi:hypothetical protein
MRFRNRHKTVRANWVNKVYKQIFSYRSSAISIVNELAEKMGVNFDWKLLLTPEK